MARPSTTPLRIAGAAAGGIPVAPHVAAHLAAFADGDERVIGELAIALTPEQLRGAAVLPDPLPLVPSARSSTLDHIRTAERRLLLFAALDPDVPLGELLDAAGVEIDVLLFGEPHEILRIDGGQARFTDERIRAQVIHDSTRAERRPVHEALARTAMRSGRAPAAARHMVAADPRRQSELTVPLLVHADALLAAGDSAEAHRVAGLVARAGGDAALRAWITAAVGALWTGAFDDASDAVRNALRIDSGEALLQDLVRLLDLMRSGPTELFYSAEETGFIYRALATSTRNIADRALMMQLGQVYTAAYRDVRVSDALHARALLASASLDDPSWSPHAAAHLAASQTTALVLAGELDMAAHLIARTAPRLPLAHPGGGVTASYVRACLGRAPGLDEELARAFERIGPTSPMRFDPELARTLFPERVSERAAAASAMSPSEAQSASLRPAPLPAESLSPRQHDVLELLLRGLSNREIGAHLSVSHRTVEVHATQLLRKYGVATRSALLALHAATVR
ncbi:MAG: helix-turn-helix transcriptional regulator [Actinobacteria bacterium]|nr:helix-turn-helix transcriptional regulator [Actinomycetota bacterium]